MDATKIREAKERDEAAAEAEPVEDDDGQPDDVTSPDETPDEGDAGPEAQQQRGYSEKEWEAASKKINAAADKYMARVVELLGPEAGGVEVSPLDWVPGFTNAEFAAALPEDRKDRIRTLIGDKVAEPLNFDPTLVLCEPCNGYGRLANPSKVPGQNERVCTQCGGTGVQTKAPEPVPLPTTPPAATWQPTTATTGVNGGQTDSWGRPLGHQHYGTPPALVGA